MYISAYRWRRQWHPTLVLLPGKSHGRGSLVGCSPWGHEELDMAERLHFHFSCIGEGNGSPLQCSDDNRAISRKENNSHCKLTARELETQSSLIQGDRGARQRIQGIFPPALCLCNHVIYQWQHTRTAVIKLTSMSCDHLLQADMSDTPMNLPVNLLL